MDAHFLFNNPPNLQKTIQEKIWSDTLFKDLSELSEAQLKKASVVLFILSAGSACPCDRPADRAPCLILNKRSAKVRQAGDLCCPGGGLSWAMDRFLAHFFILTGLPLRRWRLKGLARGKHRNAARVMRLFLAAGLREAWEEMRLNPLRFRVLGVLPAQHLVMFDRVIYPIVGWASSQRYRPNWEVARIVPICLRDLINPDRYGRFRPMMAASGDSPAQPLRPMDFPCYIHDGPEGPEMLWGATYRIVLDFLRLVLDFVPPLSSQSPLMHRALDETYLNGSR
jgi:hypothetical protein